MEKQRRREIVQAYKERKPQVGVFQVRCAVTGETWVGTSRALDTQQNGIWFGLRQGGYRSKTLQAAWKAHGEAAFELSVLERFEDDDAGAYVRDNWLKARLIHWREDLGAFKAID
jgi:hypothetical protein